MKRIAAVVLLLAGCSATPSADAGTDAITTSDSGACSECAAWTAALAIAPRDAVGATMEEAVANCVVQMHRSDCCGAQRAYGVNHAARGSMGMPKLCHAEDTCLASEPSSTECTSDVVTVDTGETTNDASLVRVHGVPATPCPSGACVRCETILCAAGDAACLALEGVNAMQCGG